MKLYSNPDSEKYKKKLKNKLGETRIYMLNLIQEADKNGKNCV